MSLNNNDRVYLNSKYLIEFRSLFYSRLKKISYSSHGEEREYLKEYPKFSGVFISVLQK
jgi:hypothetical protein